jgi:hypothetical protein
MTKRGKTVTCLHVWGRFIFSVRFRRLYIKFKIIYSVDVFHKMNECRCLNKNSKYAHIFHTLSLTNLGVFGHPWADPETDIFPAHKKSHERINSISALYWDGLGLIKELEYRLSCLGFYVFCEQIVIKPSLTQTVCQILIFRHYWLKERNFLLSKKLVCFENITTVLSLTQGKVQFT